jgi:hypothetical protein
VVKRQVWNQMARTSGGTTSSAHASSATGARAAAIVLSTTGSPRLALSEVLGSRCMSSAMPGPIAASSATPSFSWTSALAASTGPRSAAIAAVVIPR